MQENYPRSSLPGGKEAPIFSSVIVLKFYVEWRWVQRKLDFGAKNGSGCEMEQDNNTVLSSYMRFHLVSRLMTLNDLKWFLEVT